MVNKNNINYFTVLDIKKPKGFMEKISYKIGSKNKTSLETSIKNMSYKLLKDEISYIFESYDFKDIFNKTMWIKDEEYRKKIISLFQNNKSKIYPCNLNNSLVKKFEELVNGQLYIGSDNLQRKDEFNLMFYIKYTGNQIFSFSDWSEGQKVLFIMLLIGHYGDYDLVLIDELENNLHPEFISLILSDLKEHIPQIIITSHNPHIIFSTLINDTWYIETNIQDNLERIPTTIALQDKMRSQPKKSFPPFERTIMNINKDYEKISKIYNLFDKLDNKLLKLSLFTYTEINQYILESVKNIFHYEAIPATNNTRADVQSSKLGEMLLSLNIENIKILDYGAGKGRTYFELKKNNIHNYLNNSTYHFWEGFKEHRDELIQDISSSLDINSIEIISDVENVNKNYYDVIFLSNVVHECNPSDLAKILKHCKYALKDKGKLIIVELSPLLAAEKYAVSYTSEEMRTILDTTGWRVAPAEELNISNKAISAYWVSAEKRPDANLTLQEIEAKILLVWSRIEDKFASHYEGIDDIQSIKNFNDTITALTILTSIVSYKNKRWEGYLTDNYYYSLS